MPITKIADPNRLHYYYHDHISGNVLKAYEDILDGYYTMKNEVPIEDLGLSIDKVRMIHEMVIKDHPEIFWSNGYFSYYLTSSYVKSLQLIFTMDLDERNQCQQELDQVMPMYTNTLRGRMKDCEAALKIYERMIYLLDYDSLALLDEKRDKRRGNYDIKKPDHLRSIYGALVEKKAVCTGYAKGFQYIMNRLGIECLAVSGISRGHGNHQWNIIRLGGQYYHIDVTWGDGSNTDPNKSKPGISYNQFCLTDQDIKKSRTVRTDLRVPECNAKRYNYYYLKNLYVPSYSIQVVSDLIKDHLVHKKNKVIRLRFSSLTALRRAEKDLFEDQVIFKIMEEAGRKCELLWHQNDTDLYTMKIWAEGWT